MPLPARNRRVAKSQRFIRAPLNLYDIDPLGAPSTTIDIYFQRPVTPKDVVGGTFFGQTLTAITYVDGNHWQLTFGAGVESGTYGGDVGADIFTSNDLGTIASSVAYIGAI